MPLVFGKAIREAIYILRRIYNEKHPRQFATAWGALLLVVSKSPTLWWL